MSANFVQESDRINYLNTGDTTIVRGDVVIDGSLVGVALGSIAPGELGVVKTDGVWDVDASSTATFAVGATVYFDKSDKQCVAATTDDTITLGCAVEEKTAGATIVQVKLDPK
jgi:predicted RecA/RadA family phage recombinase